MKRILVLVLLIGCVGSPSEKMFLSRVVDGDTIELSNETKVRLIGINTPEKGKRLWDEAKLRVEWFEGDYISLERDVTGRDKYGRLLRYVHTSEGMLNKMLVEEGLAHVYRTENKKHLNELMQSESIARKERKGVWEESNVSCVVLLDLDEEKEFFVLSNECPYKVNLTSWSVKDEATNSFDFPLFVLDELVTVHSGKGVNNATDLYWNKSHVWNNDFDRFFLRDEKGFLVAFEEY